MIQKSVFKTSGKDSDYFFTYDLGCAAALVSLCYKINTLNRDNPKKIKFIFDSSNEIRLAAEKYWEDKLTVAARTYFNNIKMLKNRVFSE